MPDAHVEAGRLFDPPRALSVATRRDEQALITGAETALLAAQRKGAWVSVEKADLRPVNEKLTGHLERTRQARVTVRATIGRPWGTTTPQDQPSVRQTAPPQHQQHYSDRHGPQHRPQR